jgi:hypothetical protein
MMDINPYHYTHNDPMNRIDPDGKVDKKALIENSLKFVVNASLSVISLGAMAASGAIEIGSGGTASSFSLPAFFASLGWFSYNVINTEESIINIALAIRTPDGIKMEDFSIIEKVVAEATKEKSYAEAAKLIWDLIGCKGASNLGQQKIIEDISILLSAGASAEDIIEYIQTVESKSVEKTKPENVDNKNDAEEKKQKSRKESRKNEQNNKRDKHD